MNAKTEFLAHIVRTDSKVKCASISWQPDTFNPLTTIAINLLQGFDMQIFNQFLDKLNFDYNNGYGSQQLYGVIWYEDGSWSERGEYDGSEWWEHRKCPKIEFAEDTTEPNEFTYWDGDITDPTYGT
jgi:hypothetical protein